MGRSVWQEGRRAWVRLNGWHQSDPTATAGHRTGKGDAMAALQDLRLVRGLIDQAEVNAVVTARAAGATWAEIAGTLGVEVEEVQARWPEEA